MTQIRLKPVLMGAAMGLMMLWMMHDTLMNGGTNFTAGVVFVGAHLVIFGIILMGARFASRLSPKVTGWINRLHRPKASHLLSMLIGAAGAAGIAHLILHAVFMRGGVV